MNSVHTAHPSDTAMPCQLPSRGAFPTSHTERRDPMLTTPMDVLTHFPVRKTKGQKHAFREAVVSYARSQGYEAAVESGSFGVRNVVIGNPDKAKTLITAHYDTCARLPFPNLITPCSFLGFWGYQLLITLAMLIPPALVGWAASLLWGSTPGRMIFLVALWADILTMLIGPANPSNANDNTSGVVTVLEILRTLPENLRSDTCFVLFDLEEAGLLGSAAYRKAHRKATDRQLVVNLDCVGEGDELRFFPTKRLLKNNGRIAPLYAVCGYFGKKSLLVKDKGFAVYPSDQMNFPYGVGIAALNRKKKTLYLSRIHTPADTCLEETNVNLLRAALITCITRAV